MISVPKITLPPSAVTWARKIAISSPPSCRAASIDAARMIAIIAMLATIRDGKALAGRTPVERIASSNPVGGRIASMIVLRKRGGDEGDADPQRRRENPRDRRENLVEHGDRRPGDGFDPEHLQRGDRNGDDDQRKDEDAGGAGDACTGRSPALPRAALRPGRLRTVPSEEPIPTRASRPSILAAISTVSTSRLTIRATIRPTKKIKPGADQPGQEDEYLGHQLVDRRQDLREAEELQRGHDADQPDDQLGDRPELVADRLVRRAGHMLLERGAAVDRLFQHPA